MGEITLEGLLVVQNEEAVEVCIARQLVVSYLDHHGSNQ